MTSKEPHFHDLHDLQPPPVTITAQWATSHQDSHPSSVARSQEDLSTIASSGRGGGPSECVPGNQDLIFTLGSYGLYELGQVT